MLLEHAASTILDRPHVVTTLSSSFREKGFGGAIVLQLIIKFQDLRPVGERVGLPYKQVYGGLLPNALVI
jgi:hypothetical protein